MQDLTRNLIVRNETKIVLLVMDGLGGLPAMEGPNKGRTELEAAPTPNLDALASVSSLGAHTPVAMAITPGSGPGHLGLFGYDPIRYQIGRGILEALGLGLDVTERDIAFRCNYATMKDGLIVDRRAGRIPTAESRKLTLRLQEAIAREGEAEITFAPGMEHRFAVRLRYPRPLAPGASHINDTDPQKEGKAPLDPVGETEQARMVAADAKRVAARAVEVLKGEKVANHILMRGFSEKPQMPTFAEATGLRALAVAAYPMYRGVAKLVGMDAPDLTGEIREEMDFLKSKWNEYDFFFVHIKKVDSYGEDGNFEAKAKKIAEVDYAIPEILALKPDVLLVTGDHSTPAVLKAHSWHPVPMLIHSPYVLGGISTAFSERECVRGELGVFPAVNLMPLMLAHAGRLRKFGA
jgi:2,3-bisphosphoglycerate-independent phosphoglycerate mutase